MIAILCPAAALILAVVLSIIPMLVRKKKHSSFKQSVAIAEFNPTAYLERIETTFCELLEAEDSESYTLILWWGLDGLRLNKGGTTEWISRKKKVSAPVIPHVPTYPRYPIFYPANLLMNQNAPLFYPTGCENTISQLSRQNTITNMCQASAFERQHIQDLEMNILSLKFAVMQAEQNRAITNSLCAPDRDAEKMRNFMRGGGI